jgi:hypothetical protein
MYRANFHGKGAFPPSNDLMFTKGIFAQLPGARQDSIISVIDNFSSGQSSFAMRLHKEIRTLNQRNNELNEKLDKNTFSKLTQEEQKAMIQEYSLLKRSGQMLALMVEHMQKCTASILANFRS